MAEAFEKATDFDSIPLNLEPLKKSDESSAKASLDVKEISANATNTSLPEKESPLKEKKDNKKTHSLKRFFNLKKAEEELEKVAIKEEAAVAAGKSLDNDQKRGSLARRLRLKTSNLEKKDKKKNANVDADDNQKIPKTRSLQSTLSNYWENIFHNKTKKESKSTANNETQTHVEKEPIKKHGSPSPS